MSRPLHPLPPLDERQRYSITEAAAYLRQARSTTYSLIQAGLLRVIRERGRTYVPGSEIARRSTVPTS